jgi:hypothetical protein
MRKERKGPLGAVAGLAEDVLAGVRRRQRDREPKVVLYDSAGHARTLAPDAPGRDEILETAEKMVALLEEERA